MCFPKTFHNIVEGFGETQRTKFLLSLLTLITNNRYFTKFENFLIYICSVNSSLLKLSTNRLKFPSILAAELAVCYRAGHTSYSANIEPFPSVYYISLVYPKKVVLTPFQVVAR